MIENIIYKTNIYSMKVLAVMDKPEDGIVPISPEEFSSRIIEIWLYLKEIVSAIIVPLALLGMSISILVFIVSSFTRSETGKKYGLGGLLSSLSAIFLYWTLPLLAGIVSNVAKILNGG